jgi:hypothetical protein
LYSADEFIRPRLEVRILDREDDNLPSNDEFYQLSVDASETQLIADIGKLQTEIAKEVKAKKHKHLIEAGQLKACILGNHLFQPFFIYRRGALYQLHPLH